MVSSRFPLKPIHHYNDCFHLNFMVFYGHLISRPWHDRHHGTTAGVPHSHVPWFVKIMVSWFPRKWTRWNHRKRSGKKTRTWYFNAAQWTILTYIVDNGMGFCGQFSRCFWHMTWDLCFNVALDFFYTCHGSYAPTFSDGIFYIFFLWQMTDDMGFFDQIWQESWDFWENPFFSPRRNLFWIAFKSAVGKVWEAGNEAWGRVWAAHYSQEWDGVEAGLGRVKMNYENGLRCFVVPESDSKKHTTSTTFRFIV